MSENVDPKTLLEPAASRVRDPVSGRSVWLAGMVRNTEFADGRLRFELWFGPQHSRDDRRAIEAAITANLQALGYEGDVLAVAKIDRPAGKAQPKRDPVPGMSGPGMGPHGGPIQKMAVPGVRHILAVASGKGGVGKSTVSTNLAVALARQGHRVGLVDADIYGPSLPTMLGIDRRPMGGPNGKILPLTAHGVKCISMGMFVPKHEAMIWRGPMVMGAVRQLIRDVEWGELDYLIVDLPPGTGDAQLTLIQLVTISGAVIVTTPQEVALADAIRGITMFRKLDVPLLGLVENMAYYQLPSGERDYVFGEGGGVRTANELGTEVLAQIPLRTSLRASGDAGRPAALGDDAIGTQFQELAKAVSAQLPVDAE